ncbi:MAG: hypothetical protein R3C99_10575 [Pirellulaceae bacterium]|nr:hypothetical protein [Planctomycetales bacterium]MCA9163643.1 hypothetical protein [Planctomycetales bacterium]MCA9222279.1 hypothetical protein [Planctomycetales bacterium]
MLRRIELPDVADLPQPSPEADRLIAEANRRIEHFSFVRQGPLIPNFVACDFASVNSALAWIAARQLAPGRAFCEWGSGFGVVTLLAALHEFDACGIEVEATLIDEARRLADDFNIAADFAHGSAIPPNGQDLIEYAEDVAHIDTDSFSGYDQLGLEIDDFDLYFAFPWPGERAFWESLFDHYAAAGALLLTFEGREDMRLCRHV